VYWRENDGMWLGHLEDYPDYITQGETLDELKDNLKDILKELGSNAIPMVRIHEEMAL
jgi:predicted RNase H-like HicB family nuclease